MTSTVSSLIGAGCGAGLMFLLDPSRGARRRAIVRDTVDDRSVCERARAELGRVASHPRAIAVISREGVVTLAGDALADEVPLIVAAISRVRGVDEVRNQIVAHPNASRIPALQRRAKRPGRWSTWLRGNWSPRAMAAAGAGAAVLAVAIARR
jgi:BON domain